MDAKKVPFKSMALEAPQTPLLKAIDMIISRATDEDSRQRHQSVAELRQDLEKALDAHAANATQHAVVTKAPFYVRWIWAGIGLAVLLVGGMAFYHLMGGTRTAVFVPPAMESDPHPAENIKPTGTPLSRVSPDGRTMTLIQGTDTIARFYSDASLVTFHHYVEFLNEVADELTVDQDIVKKKDMILVYVGDGTAPEDQIIHQNGRFRLRNAEWAAKPVVRVTWLGAQAYAQYYGKRLPTFKEWEAVRRQLADTVRPTLSSPGLPTAAPNSHLEMMKQFSGDTG